MSSKVVITFNGEQCEVQSSTVHELLQEFSLLGKKIAVEKNREVVARTAYQSTPVEAEDNIEIIQFVGGG